MADKVQICNMALTRLGAAPITGLGDKTTNANRLSAIYDQVADNVMSLGPWTSASKRATLAMTDNTPVFGYNYEYQLPTEPRCIRVLEINECELGDVEYAIEGDKLLTNLTSVQIKYIAYVSDPEQYDSYLRQAITERLIVELSYSITGTQQVMQAMEQAFLIKVEGWLNINSSQGSSKDLPSNTFTNVRNEN